MRRSLEVLAVLVILGVLGVLAAAPAGSQLRIAGSQEPTDHIWYGVGALVPSRQESRNFSEVVLCMQGDGAATITGVHFREGDGLVIDDFGVREYTHRASGIGVDVTKGTLTSAGFTRTAVTAACDEADRATYFGYTLRLTSDRGWGRWMVLDYAIGERVGQLVIPGEMAMCVGTDSSGCRPPDEPLT
ncbi:MAG: hypothetical protein ACTHJJ_09790 [Intrasporangium sp.]|uniref:hypothetical protein n=1 Tax=Intrasporangium sp. TaxID=1925024 RepID=UPI003F7F6E03